MKNKIQQTVLASRDKPLKSIYDVYQERDLFVQFYKCLKMAEVCCYGNKDENIIDGNVRNWLLEIADKVNLSLTLSTPKQDPNLIGQALHFSIFVFFNGSFLSCRFICACK